MSVGTEATKNDLDARAGTIAGAFQRAFNDAINLQGFLEAKPDADLVALGYTADEVASLKTAFVDLSQLARIWIGAEALAAPKDFRTFVRRLWGIGSF